MKTMKATALLAATVLAMLSVGPRDASAQQFTNGDFSKGTDGWGVSFQNELTAKVAVVPDAFRGKPALVIEVPETDASPWRGQMSQSVAFPSPGIYTISFFAKVEPGDDDEIRLSNWSDTQQNLKMNGAKFNLQSDWQECSCTIEVEAGPQKAAIVWSGLARSGKKFSFANIRIAKDE
jgi:hypothetical protein